MTFDDSSSMGHGGGDHHDHDAAIYHPHGDIIVNGSGGGPTDYHHRNATTLEQQKQNQELEQQQEQEQRCSKRQKRCLDDHDTKEKDGESDNSGIDRKEEEHEPQHEQRADDHNHRQLNGTQSSVAVNNTEETKASVGGVEGDAMQSTAKAATGEGDGKQKDPHRPKQDDPMDVDASQDNQDTKASDQTNHHSKADDDDDDENDDDESQEERDTEFVDSFIRQSASVNGAVYHQQRNGAGGRGDGFVISSRPSTATASPALLVEEDMNSIGTVNTVSAGGTTTTTTATSTTTSSSTSTDPEGESMIGGGEGNNSNDDDMMISNLLQPYHRRKHSSSISLQEFSLAPPQPEQQQRVVSVFPVRPANQSTFSTTTKGQGGGADADADDDGDDEDDQAGDTTDENDGENDDDNDKSKDHVSGRPAATAVGPSMNGQGSAGTTTINQCSAEATTTSWREETAMMLNSPSPAALWTTDAFRGDQDSYEATYDDFEFLDDLGFGSTVNGGSPPVSFPPPPHASAEFMYGTSAGTSTTTQSLPLMLPEEQPTGSASAVAAAAAAVAAASHGSHNTMTHSTVGNPAMDVDVANNMVFDPEIGSVLSPEATEKILDDIQRQQQKQDVQEVEQQQQQPPKATRKSSRRASSNPSPRSSRATKTSKVNANLPPINVEKTKGGTTNGGRSKRGTNNGTSGSGTPRTSNRSLPSHVVEYLKSWLHDPKHIDHPFPTDQEKQQMLEDTGLDLKRLNNWFVNYRYRHWKPQMEAAGKLIVNKHGSTTSSTNNHATKSSSISNTTNNGRQSNPVATTTNPVNVSNAKPVTVNNLTTNVNTSSVPSSERTTGTVTVSASAARTVQTVSPQVTAQPHPVVLPAVIQPRIPPASIVAETVDPTRVQQQQQKELEASKGNVPNTTTTAPSNGNETAGSIPPPPPDLSLVTSKTTRFGVPNPLSGQD